MKNRFEVCGSVTKVFDLKNNEFLIDTDMIEYVGRLKWFVDKSKDRVVSTTEPRIMLHQYLMGKGHECIDHINRNRLDNRLCNLRICTVLQNNMNRGVSKNNRCGYKGVAFDRSKGKYKASIGLNNKKIHIGYYDSVEEASKAYNRAALHLFGDYAPYQA